MHVLVTGGAGFIGSHIVEYLLKNNSKVTVFDNLSSGKLQNIEKFLDNPNFRFIEGDILDMDALRKAMVDTDAICHQAALVSVPGSVADPLSFHQCNVDGFLNVLTVAKEHGVKRVVYASTSAVYGDDTRMPKIESVIGCALSPYALTKYTNELYAKLFTDLYGMECIGLRYFNIFGPRQDPNGPYAAVIPKFITALQKKQQPVIYGDGSNTRDFIYVENVAHANVLALTTHNTTCFGEVFNIGSGDQMSILEMLDCIREQTGSSINPIFKGERPGDIAHSGADISKALTFLCYSPIVSFKEGITKLYNVFI